MFNYDFRLKKINNNLNFTAKNSKNTNSSYINKNGECDSVSFNQKPNGKNIFRNAFAIVSTAIIALFPTASKVNADNQQRYAQPQLEPNGIYYDTAEENGYFDEIPVVAKNTSSDVHTTTIIVEERPIESSVVKYAPLDYYTSTVVIDELPVENSVVKYAPLDAYTSTVVIDELPFENSAAEKTPSDVHTTTIIVEERPIESSVVKYAPLDYYTSTVVIDELPVENSVVKYAPLDVEPFNDETTVTITKTVNIEEEYPVENSVVKYAPLDVEPFNDETTVTITKTVNINEYPTVE